MTTAKPLNSISDIVRQHDAAGSHWFEADTMKFFKSQVSASHCYPSEAQRCTYFVTSEQPPDGARAWSVRKASWDRANISTVGEFCGYKKLANAGNTAKALAGLKEAVS
jgi:hypothetical protein